MRSPSTTSRRPILCLALATAVTLSIAMTGPRGPGAGVALAADTQYSCAGTTFFASAGVGTVFREGDVWQGATFSDIEGDSVVRVREPEPDIVVGRISVGTLGGDSATIDFNRIIRIVAIFWFDNDPNPGEAGWSLNGLMGPLTGDRGALWQEVNEVTDTVHIDAGGDSGGVDFCYEEVAPEGCTPGYWKQSHHFDSWRRFGPNETLESVFSVPNSLGLDDVTLLAALQGGGGSGTVGAAKILLRAGVAGLLNAAQTDATVAYPRTVGEVIDDVNAALASANRATMLNLAGQLDADNNAGCPLN